MPIKNKIKLNLSVTEEDIYRRGSWKGEGRKEISRATCAASTSAKYLSARSSRGLSRYSFRDDATWRGPRYTRHALSVVFRSSSSSSFFFCFFSPKTGLVLRARENLSAERAGMSSACKTEWKTGRRAANNTTTFLRKIEIYAVVNCYAFLFAYICVYIFEY